MSRNTIMAREEEIIAEANRNRREARLAKKAQAAREEELIAETNRKQHEARLAKKARNNLK